MALTEKIKENKERKEAVNVEEITFFEISEEWLMFKKNEIKESTYCNYKFKIETNFWPVFGNKTIKELLEYNFNKYVNKLKETLADKTIKDIMNILKGILRYIELKYEVNFKLELISSPKVIQKEVEIFTEEERKRIEKECIENINLKKVGVLISIYTGIRIGEICALKWKDIDFINRTINVSHTLQRIYTGRKKTKIIYTTPKSKKSIRKIPISSKIYNLLKDVYEHYSRDLFVLTGKEEKWLEPMTYRNMYKDILEKSDVKYKKYHVLRHTFATRCVKNGMDIKSLSEILGHSNVSITLNLYIHSSLEIKRKFIEKL